MEQNEAGNDTARKLPLKLIIKPQTIEYLKHIPQPDDTIRALIDISEGVYTPKDGVDGMWQAAFALIQSDSEQERAAKSRAGTASAVKRLSSNVEKPRISIPKFVPPKGLRSLEFGKWPISAIERLQIRYIMLYRNYGVGEGRWFLNTYLVKNETKNMPVSSKIELMERAQTWDNFNRGCRFPECPEFQKICLTIMQSATPEDRSLFLDYKLNIRRMDKGCYVIFALPQVISIIRALEPGLAQLFTCTEVRQIEYIETEGFV